MRHNAIAIGLAVMLEFAGCKSKSGDAKAPAPTRAPASLPTPPAGSGITVRADGPATIVSDTIGKTEVRFPGTIDSIVAQTVDMGEGERPAVLVHESLEHGLLFLMAVRLNDDDIPSPIAIKAAYDGALDELDPTDGGTSAVTDRAEITMLGESAIRFTQKVAQNGRTGIMRTWVVYDPEHKVFYSLKASHEGDATTDPVEDQFAASFKR